MGLEKSKITRLWSLLMEKGEDDGVLKEITRELNRKGYLREIVDAEVNERVNRHIKVRAAEKGEPGIPDSFPIAPPAQVISFGNLGFNDFVNGIVEDSLSVRVQSVSDSIYNRAEEETERMISNTLKEELRRQIVEEVKEQVKDQLKEEFIEELQKISGKVTFDKRSEILVNGTAILNGLTCVQGSFYVQTVDGEQELSGVLRKIDNRLEQIEESLRDLKQKDEDRHFDFRSMENRLESLRDR